MEFTHEVIDDNAPCGRLGICLPTDLTGNGVPDVIVGGLGREKLPLLGVSGVPLVGRLLRRLETSIFWYENPGWKRHDLTSDSDLHVFGNALGDVTGNGRFDLFAGQAISGRDIYWFEQPSDPRRPWTKRLVGRPFSKYHDLAFGDVDNDGEPELVGASQNSEVVFYYDVPDNPAQSPWPEDCLHVIEAERNVEGLAVVDIDGDGRNELIAGPNVYQYRQDTPTTDGGAVQLSEGWHRETIVNGWDWTRLAVGDLDGDGELEVVLSEGDSPLLGSRMGRVGWFDPPEWETHILRDDMYCPHSLQLADFDGNGWLDIYVAEMGLGTNDDPEHVIFQNRGGGEFEEMAIESTVPTHEAKAVDVNGNGWPDIVGKSYTPGRHVDVWYNRNGRGDELQ